MDEAAEVIRRERLFRLLPAVHRILDAGQGGPLRELLSVIGEQANLLEDDLGRAYDNYFIETCEPWVIPYLGELVGYTASELATLGDPDSKSGQLLNQVLVPRREAANTVGYRRRKGSLALLEELAREIVGWPALACEFRRQVAGAAAINHFHVRRSSTVDVRDRPSLAQLHTPFDRLSRTVDVRQINSTRTPGRFNLPAVGLFVWRRQVYRATEVPACVIDRRGYFTCDPTGLDVLLHIDAQPESDPRAIAEVVNLPVPLTRELLATPDVAHTRTPIEGLSNEVRDRHRHKGMTASPEFYGRGRSLAICVQWQNSTLPYLIPTERVAVWDLEHWKIDWDALTAVVGPSLNQMAAACRPVVAIDPERGRLVFDPARVPARVWTTHHYGLGMDLGGGEYDRQLPSPAHVRKYSVIANPEVGEFATLDAALQRWLDEQSRPHAAECAIIEILDNENYALDSVLEVPIQRQLEIRAANLQRPSIGLTLDGRQQHANVEIHGNGRGTLILSGLRIAVAELRITGSWDSIVLRDCTILPGVTRLVFATPGTTICVERSIIGQIVSLPPEPDQAAIPSAAADRTTTATTAARSEISPEPPHMFVENSILGASDHECPERDSAREVKRVVTGVAQHPAWLKLSLRNVTAFGHVHVGSVELIENSLLLDRLCVTNQQQGCVRFSYVACGSHTPQRTQCQPDLAIAAAGNSPDQPAAVAQARVRVRPRLISELYGEADFARLADDCPREIVQGAADEGEMGALHDAFFSQRAALLRSRLNEFVPADCAASIIFET